MAGQQIPEGATGTPQAVAKDKEGVHHDTVVKNSVIKEVAVENSPPMEGEGVVVVNDPIRANEKEGVADTEYDPIVDHGGPVKEEDEAETWGGFEKIEDYLKFKDRNIELILSPDVPASGKEALLSQMALQARLEYEIYDTARGFHIFTEKIGELLDIYQSELRRLRENKKRKRCTAELQDDYVQQ